MLAFIGLTLKAQVCPRNHVGRIPPFKTLLFKINLTSGMRFFQGGSLFVIVMLKRLPPEVKSAWAEFGKKAVTHLERANDFNLIGQIPGKFFMAPILEKILYFPFSYTFLAFNVIFC